MSYTGRMEEVREVLEKMTSSTKADLALVEKAYHFAAEAHKDHKRFSGEPYLTHLVETSRELAKTGMSAKVVAAGLLHDTIEDAGVEPEQLDKEFGKEIRFLVEGVTKLGHLKYRGAERHRESLRKLLIATGQDARVLIIKLMDRLHNMRTLRFVPEHKQARIALETLEIYAAIAHRLGMGVVRRELEDLAFEYAYPGEYARTKHLLTERSKQTLERLHKMSRTLAKELGTEGLKDFRTDYRVKGLYSLWRKLRRKGGDIEKIYDVAALRVIVRDVPDCYRVLGIVNRLWQPLPNKIKDYIAFPKPNGYQSLHTTVFSGDGGIVEIQIRTEAMHQEAEYGITSHVHYKEGRGGKAGRTSFDWIKSLLPGFRRHNEQRPEAAPRAPGATDRPRSRRYGARGGPQWLEELSDGAEDPDFEHSLKADLFSARVFVFTPKGDVVDLPHDSSPVDFAYAIHSDVGDHVFASKINGKMMPIDSILENGDIVEIVTRKSAGPTKKWLDFAKTTLARRHIRAALEKEGASKARSSRG